MALAACFGALGVVQAFAVAAPVGAGDVPEDQGDEPVVDGVTIVATYRYEGMPFFQGGYILRMPQADNFLSIDCGANGVVNPIGGPEGAPECAFHPAAKEATVTITGKVPWFEVEQSFVLVPYWSFDDKTYVKGDPITITADAPKPAPTAKEQAGVAYLEVSTTVNLELEDTLPKVRAWDATTTGKQAAADVADLDKALERAKTDLKKKVRKKYPGAKKAIKAQIKAIDAVRAHLLAAGGINEGVDLVKWMDKFEQYLEKLADTSDEVRARLGLAATNDIEFSGDQPPDD